MGFGDEQKKIDAVIATFPAEFGLRGFPGARFRLSSSASYFSGETLMLYTERFWAAGEVSREAGWRDFVKGTESELRAQITK